VATLLQGLPETHTHVLIRKGESSAAASSAHTLPPAGALPAG
jgi:hypothetical protein